MNPPRALLKRRFHLHHIVLALAAFVAVLPLVLHGCSCGHDFDFHILNWMEAARQFAHGNLHPHWAYTPAFNAGEPRFVFYPPLSWTIGAILGFLMPWTWTPIAYTWLALTGAGFALYYLAREFATPTAALLAATFYIVNPYTLFTAYERTAYAELLAAAWIPLLLHAILRERVTIPRIAIPVALLWLTDAPAAVMGCYALALLGVIRLISPRKSDISRIRLAATAIAGTLLGLGIAAYYIVPAAWERRYVQISMAILPEMSIQDNFLFHHTADPLHDQVLHTASTIAVGLLIVTIVAILILAIRRRSKRWGTQCPKMKLWSISILVAVIAFLLTPWSSAIWNHVPELAFLQFPWRFLAILAAALGLALAIVLSPLKLKPVKAILICLGLAAILTIHNYKLRQQSCDEEDNVAARLALFHSNAGTEPTDEYTPGPADNDALKHTSPPYWVFSPSADINQAAPANAAPGSAPMHLTLDATAPKILVLNLRNYPSWKISRNGVPVSGLLDRDDGLVAFRIPAGLSHIDIAYRETLNQIIGDIITALSLVLLGLLLWRALTNAHAYSDKSWRP
jgi:hypothetical protein